MKIQIDDTVRDATPDEIAAIEAQRENAVDIVALIEAKTAARESARAKLAKLGLTDDELEAFLGV